MKSFFPPGLLILPSILLLSCVGWPQQLRDSKIAFQTSDRCLACHNGIKSQSGEDVSIGFAWRASIMAHSSRDPYWQASVRREVLDHPESQGKIEDECGACHMPITRAEAKSRGQLGRVFNHLPFTRESAKDEAAQDGVTCSVCHQISEHKLGTHASFSGEFEIATAKSENNHPEYGPFPIQSGEARVMQSSTGGFRPEQAAHIRDSALCATCHTLYTTALGSDGKALAVFPEQMPFLEWQHSDYSSRSSCQSCHMPEFQGSVPIAAVLGVPRPGVHQHSFVGGNVFMLKILNLYRDDLSVTALPEELTAQANRTSSFLQTQTARVIIQGVKLQSSRLQVNLAVENLTGHKFPTAYPSRRAWLHLSVFD